MKTIRDVWDAYKPTGQTYVVAPELFNQLAGRPENYPIPDNLPRTEDGWIILSKEPDPQ